VPPTRIPCSLKKWPPDSARQETRAGNTSPASAGSRSAGYAQQIRARENQSENAIPHLQGHSGLNASVVFSAFDSRCSHRLLTRPQGRKTIRSQRREQ
jgi:hypothetical protein